MGFLLIAVTVVLQSIQSVFQKQYTSSFEKPKMFSFLALSCFMALIFFTVRAGFKFNFSPEFVPYSIAFSLMYTTAWIGTIFALRLGMLSMTTLVISYSLIIPTLYGIIFLHEPISKAVYFGIALLMVAMFLLNAKKETEKKKVSFKWVICAACAFIGNGGCSTTQKIQLLRFDGAYRNEFMMLAMAIATIILFSVAIFQKENIFKDSKDCVIYATLNGLSNGGCNMMVMILNALIPNAILFPSISAGGMILSFIFAVGIYREKLSRRQIIAYAVAVASIVFMNL